MTIADCPAPIAANPMLPAGFRVLVAYEESQTVCKAFRNLGIEAFSCDVTKLSGLVDVELIHSLRQIADDLEEQNTLVNEKDN